MINRMKDLRRFTNRSSSTMTFNTGQINYGFSVFSRFTQYLRQMLNKIANEDSRTLKTKDFTDLTKSGNQIQQMEAPPKNALQAQKRFQAGEQIISSQEHGRLQRIDDILGTRTYFHETKLYQQRLDSEHVMNISRLYQKFKQPSRQSIQYTNPQIKPKQKFKNKRKYHSKLKYLRKYPQARPFLKYFTESPQHQHKSQINSIKIEAKQQQAQLIQMLSEQAMFTNLSLAQLNLTIDSIAKQKIYLQKQDGIIQAELDQQPLIINQYTYFQPTYSTSIYRISTTKYTNKLRQSLQQLVRLQQQKQANLQQLFTVQQIYECLKQYYYDERVTEYIKKIENNNLDYFITNLHVSPDLKHLAIIIDLLGTKKQYTIIYKYCGLNQHQSKQIVNQNILFNVLPNMAMKNQGILYHIQRSQEGMFTELVRTKFNSNGIQYGNKLRKKQLVSNNNSNSKQQQQSEFKQLKQSTTTNNDNNNDRQLDSRIMYKCAPYCQLRILLKKQAVIVSKKQQINSTNSNNNNNNNNNSILVQQIQSTTPEINNKIYLINHQQNLSNIDDISKLFQQITINTRNANRFKDIKNTLPEYLQDIYHYQNNKNIKVHHDCYQIFNIGYLLVRYQLKKPIGEIGFSGEQQLKYGLNNRVAHFVTIIPYAGVDLGLKKQANPSLLMFNKHQLVAMQSSLSNTDNQQNITTNITQTENLQTKLKTSSRQLIIPSTQSNQHETLKLNLSGQSVLYACKEQQFISQLSVQHLSHNNIYLLMSMSVESIYNRSFVTVYPIRAGIKSYSIFLDGYPVKITNTFSSDLKLNVASPLLNTKFTYKLWNKQLKQVLNQRVYSETVTIQSSGQAEQQLQIKILSLEKFISKKNNQKQEMIILYVPSIRNQSLDQLTVRKILEKGVMLIEVTKCPGIFGTDMIQLLRGVKKRHFNNMNSIRKVIQFIRDNISQNLAVYAKGGPACYSTLLLNIFENQDGEFFDVSVLHNGIYDIKKVPNPQTQKYQYFFGDNQEIWKGKNPMDFILYDPKKQYPKQSSQNNNKQQQQTIDFSKVMIRNLHNILITNLNAENRSESRKFIHKLRLNQNLYFDSVYLKEFDHAHQCDLYNLGYLYHQLKQKSQRNFNQYKIEQREESNAEVINRYQRD